jgi:hypothetical protein
MMYETKITLANGGNHNPRQTKKAWEWIDQCAETYYSPRLYHVAFGNHPDFNGWASYPAHKSLLKDLMQRLRRKGMRCSFKAAREHDDKKGEHLHAYICVESAYRMPDTVINRIDNGWLKNYARKRGIAVYINEPRDPMHSGNDYISLPRSKPEKIADAKEWVSYIYKQRSKPAFGEIYTGSRTLH